MLLGPEIMVRLFTLVENRKNKYKYAIKCIGKKQIESEQIITNLELERCILL